MLDTFLRWWIGHAALLVRVMPSVAHDAHIQALVRQLRRLRDRLAQPGAGHLRRDGHAGVAALRQGHGHRALVPRPRLGAGRDAHREGRRGAVGQRGEAKHIGQRPQPGGGAAAAGAGRQREKDLAELAATCVPTAAAGACW